MNPYQSPTICDDEPHPPKLRGSLLSAAYLLLKILFITMEGTIIVLGFPMIKAIDFADEILGQARLENVTVTDTISSYSITIIVIAGFVVNFAMLLFFCLKFLFPLIDLIIHYCTT